MIEWKTRGISYHVASVGLLTLNVMTAPGSDGEHWAIYVDDSDSSATRAQVQERFVGTLDEAKARAIELATGLVAPLVAAAVAVERAAIRAEIEQQQNGCASSLRAACATDYAPVYALGRVLRWLDARSKGGAR